MPLPRPTKGPFRRAPFDFEAHEEAHFPGIGRDLIYTSTATLSTTAGTLLVLHLDAEIQWVRATVAVAPSGAALEYDVLRNGTSIFTTKPTIATGKTIGIRYKPDPYLIRARNLDTDDYVQVKVNTISSATGPLVVVMRIRGG